MSKFPVIYGLSDPETGEVRYVGKTQNELYKRLSGHWRDKRKDYKTHWITSLKKRGLKPIIDIIEVCLEDNWEEREKFWIKYFKQSGNKLTNWLEGGNGLPKGYKHSPETIEKIREAAKRPNNGKFKKGRKWEQKQAEGSWKKILQYDLDGNFVKEWRGIINASKENQINKNSITSCLRGHLNRAGSSQWKYYYEGYPLKIDKYVDRRIKTGKYLKLKNV